MFGRAQVRPHLDQQVDKGPGGNVLTGRVGGHGQGDAQDAGQFAQGTLGGIEEGTADAGITPRVDGPDQVKEGGKCAAAVEVIIQCLDKRGARVFGGLAQDIGCFAGRCVTCSRPQRRMEAGQAAFCAVQRLGRKHDRLPIVAGENQQAQHIRVTLLQKFVHCDEVAQRLAHLFAGQLEHAVVHPVAGEGFFGQALALGNFVLVMGEDEIVAAAVNVDGFAQVVQAHARAFDVPARSSRSPWAFPERLARLGRFPEREIAGEFLTLVLFQPGAGLAALQ